MNPELIECLKSFIRSKHLTNEWNIFRDNWFNEINSEASSESQSVRDNEQANEVCSRCGKPNDNDCDICYECTEEIQNIDRQTD